MEQIRELEELLQELDLVIRATASRNETELRSVRNDVYDELVKVRIVFA